MPTKGVDPKQLFRQTALKKRMEEENCDELLTIVPNRNRLGFYFLFAMCLLTLFWLFFGALPVEIKGSGIFMRLNGFFPVESHSIGFVDKIFPAIGDVVKEGDSLFIISDSKINISLEYANKQLASLEALYEKLKTDYGIEEKKIREGLSQQIASNQIKVEKMLKQIPFLEEDYEKKKKLLQEALVSSATVLNAENILLKTRTALEATKSNIATLEASLKKTYHAEELKAIEQRILSQKELRDVLLLNERYDVIKSPFHAHVLEILVRLGDPVKAHKNLMWIENGGKGINDIVVYGFVNSDVGKRIAFGQSVYIQPMNINAQEFGSLNGKVIEISPSIVAKEQISVFIHDKSLEDYLTHGSPNNYLIVIKPEIDPSTISGFKWTSGEGIPFEITTGMICSISGTAYYERPIVRLFPLWAFDELFDRIQKWLNSSFFQYQSIGGYDEHPAS